MAKALELQFLTSDGKTAKLSIDDPIEPIDTVQVKQSMDQIIAADVFFTSTDASYSAVKGARVVERNVTDYTIV
ncbi:DUF2922 domain-containing protein [Falsibacillus albus]|uniref:DUF2922 domain-containing protein n=1 Tax=Falsibacillus albus TaxID=2478915 RepID=A0A3L7JRD8_9BACI|nr:DUF2922 domain-containing protein [Falsibacillus albus]RLQ93373.1 DUF2922 domain-containing protein [Falsibacillus albus]